MTDERAIIKVGLKTCAGSSHSHGKSPLMTVSERTSSGIYPADIYLADQDELNKAKY